MNISRVHSFSATIQYKGTNYNGWQIQNGQAGKTIQGEINYALKKITKSELIHTIGSGRTDAGVHALGQVIRMDLPFMIEPIGLQRALNALIPADIRILEVKKIDESFHPIYNAKWKEYIYCFSTSTIISPFDRELVAQYPYEIDIAAMKNGGRLFLGKHDFCNFSCTGTEVKSTIREIFEFSLEPINGGHPWINLASSGATANYYLFRIRGSGFLKQMVRLIVGALFNLGRGKIKETDIAAALVAPYGVKKVGFVADPEGLYLAEVHY
ncbi:MAG TPA: tRNA pseudouridine(38-40) synthase TruA [Bacteriovoracaceae bacterium]|nr:tRNA pseudouridine(38-40) synthase TruA [Bacteriovoracaceae bacterium]